MGSHSVAINHDGTKFNPNGVAHDFLDRAERCEAKALTNGLVYGWPHALAQKRHRHSTRVISLMRAVLPWSIFGRMISKRAKYALNALRVLARDGKEGPLAAGVIAQRGHIPVKFLEAILLDLNRAGIILTKRGRNGGHMLRRPAKEIQMAEVLRLFDGAIGLVPCVTYNYYERCEECEDEETCGIRDVFVGIRAATVKLLQHATLEDVLKREKKLGK